LHWVHHVSPGSWWVPGSQFTSSSWRHPQHAARPVGSISNSKHSSAQRFSVSIYTSRTAQGGGGSFIDRGAIGQLSCWSVGDGVTGGWSVDVRLPNSVDLLGKFMYSSIFLFVPLFVYLPACHPCCLSIFLSLFLSICLSAIQLSSPLSTVSIYLSICLSVFLPICLSATLPIYLSIFLSVCLSICLVVYLCVCVSVHLSICVSICLSTYLSICLNVYLSFCNLPSCLSIFLSINQ
jgi:hypothetical protein